jgi:hypothetical protein
MTHSHVYLQNWWLQNTWILLDRNEYKLQEEVKHNSFGTFSTFSSFKGPFFLNVHLCQTSFC